MTNEHPVRFIVTAERHNVVVHKQEAATRAEAENLVVRFEAVPGTEAFIEEVHDRTETDLTAHTRELLEDLGS